MRKPLGFGVSVLIVIGITVGYLVYRSFRPRASRIYRLRQYWSDSEGYSHWAIRSGERCHEAPFVFPSDGFIGFLWGDSFRLGHTHQGIDIFAPGGQSGLGQTPVVAAYDGYLTRLPAWRSSVIIRIPEDPLQPARQIWTYYTHMADASGNSYIQPDFPPGTYDKFVRAGTLLGYQGNYSSDPDNPTGVHLHFSIVRDDGQGSFMNELEFRNTLDPSPYFGIELNARRAGNEPTICPE
jgi:murein DD-endopeptidase MepM/ murein hydrolase activator NlpD